MVGSSKMKRVSSLAAAQLAGELQALGFAAGKRWRGLAQSEVAQAQIVQDLQLVPHFFRWASAESAWSTVRVSNLGEAIKCARFRNRRREIPFDSASPAQDDMMSLRRGDLGPLPGSTVTAVGRADQDPSLYEESCPEASLFHGPRCAPFRRWRTVRRRLRWPFGWRRPPARSGCRGSPGRGCPRPAGTVRPGRSAPCRRRWGSAKDPVL